MHFIKYLCATTLFFASCRVSRNVAPIPNDEIKPTIAVAVSSSGYNPTAVHFQESSVAENNAPAASATIEETQATNAATSVVTEKKKITSFTQMKEMAKSGEIVMSKKDLKILNRLEKHYKGNYEQFRADAFELTDKAKIIGGIGVLGLLLAIITGSAFGWFLFVVAALAFLLRYLNIIAF